VKSIFLLCNIWKAEDIKNLDLDAMAEEFAEGVPDNVVPPANIAVYIKEARTPKEAVEHVRELVVEFEIAVEQENEEIRVNRVWTALMAIQGKVSRLKSLPAH
jgi:hypothetical protein